MTRQTGHKTHIIAEAGTNHNGDVETAMRLVDVAARSGADSVKFQLIYPEGLYLPEFFGRDGYTPNEVFHARHRGMLPDDGYRALAASCAEKGLGFSASVFDERGIDLMDGLGASCFKIASCDLNNSRLLKAAAERGRRMVVSTGMASLGEVERAVADIASTGNFDLVLMHCVSVYPCPLERMNLAFMDVLKSAFGFPVGLSDHTESSLAAAVAVSKEAAFIEKHFTLDRGAPGFDHAYAMEPDGLAGYIADVRACEKACSLQPEKTGEKESAVKARARRGLYAARDIAAGETLAEADVLVVRPEGPMAPNDAPRAVGRAAARAIGRYEPLSPEMFR